MPVILASCLNPAPWSHNSFMILFRWFFSKFWTSITLPMPYCYLSTDQVWQVSGTCHIIHYFHSIWFRISQQTRLKCSCSLTHSGKSLFIHPITFKISACISSTRFKFQQMDSLWKIRLRKRLNRLSGAETLRRFRSCRGIYGKARRSACHRVRSY